MNPPASSPDKCNEQQAPGIMRRATIGDTVYDNQALVRQRRKATIVACDRCRRRKIRCDSLQPCATCARFGVRCARSEPGMQRGGRYVFQPCSCLLLVEMICGYERSLSKTLSATMLSIAVRAFSMHREQRGYMSDFERKQGRSI